MMQPRVVFVNMVFIFLTVCEASWSALQRAGQAVFQENAGLSLSYDVLFTAIPMVAFLLALYGTTQRKAWGLKVLQCANAVVLSVAVLPLLMLSLLLIQYGTGPESGFDELDKSVFIIPTLFFALSAFFMWMIGRSNTKSAYEAWCDA